MAKDYEVRNEQGALLLVVRAKDTKDAKKIAKKRGYYGVSVSAVKVKEHGTKDQTQPGV